MNRHSILFKVNIIFAIAFIAVFLIAMASLHFESKHKHHEMFDSLSKIIKVLPTIAWDLEPDRLRILAASHGMSIIDTTERADILSQAEHRGPPDMDPELLPPLRPIEHDGGLYLHYHDKTTDILFKALEPAEKQFDVLPVITFSILLLLVVVYITIARSLRPLQLLQTQIKAFGEGHPIIPALDEKKDEISTLYREFYKSTQRVEAMSEARRLFLRNIMHELNTPVTKGRLIAAMVEDKNKEILQNVFERLELLIKELSHIEMISSEQYALDIRPYRISDLIEHANDLLFNDEEIPMRLDGQVMECDLEMMGVVFKNLIDNGLRHGSDLTISAQEGKVSFSSKADPLEHDLGHYTQPFVKGTHAQTHSKGLGLGLYIVKEILIKQGYTLTYLHRSGNNIFTIEKKESVETTKD